MKHKELILAAMYGKAIQYQMSHWPDDKWETFATDKQAVGHMANEYAAFQYRLAPPPDRVAYRVLWMNGTWSSASEVNTDLSPFLIQLKITFNGESDEIKSVEIVK